MGASAIETRRAETGPSLRRDWLRAQHESAARLARATPKPAQLTVDGLRHFAYTVHRVNLNKEGRTWQVLIGHNAPSWKAYRGA